MNFGVVVLIVVCIWAALSIVTSLAVGAMAQARDAEPLPADRPSTIDDATNRLPAATSRERHLAS